VAAVSLNAHAGLHVYDTAVGNLPANHWWLDLPGVYLPALATAWVGVSPLPREGATHATRADRQA